jgi:sodium transport system permease protein
LLVALSFLMASLEERAEQRVVYAVGMQHAPSLRNFLQRQSYEIKEAPAGYEARLRNAQFSDPVLVIPEDFEAELLRGDVPSLELVSDSANQRASSGVYAVQALVQAFSRERATLSLVLRGVSLELLSPVELEERDLASTQTRAARLTGILPFFVILAVVSGSLSAALDSTAGERERGSLEPLLMNPTERWALVAGKWGAVASVGMLIAFLSCLSFLPGQWLLRSDTLQAMFQYGPHEAGAFLVLLLPLAGALSAILMAVAIRCRTYKEAQASSTFVVMGVSLLPMVTIFNQGADAPWQIWVPALAQNSLMTRVLKGESLDALQIFAPLGVCVALTGLCLWFVARSLRSAATR